jgi:3-oxoacyl-[acyl-carrier-protein] synthase-3
MNTASRCGIIAVDCSIAESTMTANEISLLSGFSSEYIVESLGFERKRISLPTEQPSDFAISAAKGVLQKANLMPAQIDFLIYSSSGIYDYNFWSPSAFIQKAIGARNAVTFEINNGCNASNMGLFVASSLLAANDSWKYGLLIISDTLSKFINYSDKFSFPLFSFSDGAAAVLIAAKQIDKIILSQCFYTDGTYANCSKLQLGTKNISSRDEGKKYIQMDELKKVKILRESVMADNYVKVIVNALQQANVNSNMLNHILTNQNSSSIIKKVLVSLSIDLEKHLKTSRLYGHIGAVDVFFGLNQLLENKKLHKNDLILMATAGIGFHWGAHLLKI